VETVYTLHSRLPRGEVDHPFPEHLEAQPGLLELLAARQFRYLRKDEEQVSLPGRVAEGLSDPPSSLQLHLKVVLQTAKAEDWPCTASAAYLRENKQFKLQTPVSHEWRLLFKTRKKWRSCFKTWFTTENHAAELWQTTSAAARRELRLPRLLTSLSEAHFKPPRHTAYNGSTDGGKCIALHLWGSQPIQGTLPQGHLQFCSLLWHCRMQEKGNS